MLTFRECAERVGRTYRTIENYKTHGGMKTEMRGGKNLVRLEELLRVFRARTLRDPKHRWRARKILGGDVDTGVFSDPNVIGGGVDRDAEASRPERFNGPDAGRAVARRGPR